MGVRSVFVGGALALCLSAAASSAATVRVNVGGADWDVTTVLGTFAELEDTLIQQEWWGDQALAQLFTLAVGCELGCPGPAQFGPYFAYDLSEGSLFTVVRLLAFSSANGPFRSAGFSSDGELFAIASPAAVPLPAGGLLLLTGLAAAVGVGKRRKKVSA